MVVCNTGCDRVRRLHMPAEQRCLTCWKHMLRREACLDASSRACLYMEDTAAPAASGTFHQRKAQQGSEAC